ncbi:hypothetical protein DP939_02275 [Spongiactinospora rosea]|uniref:Uncharacterized protein n=1 Tax=Spongiactinospora rosea TaxID=2248750 RepID=A0A366M677_9ACTN|nr:hypothetical protein [Spongiactinospora rosea]RBQ21557.1 hypothetical protein DP939_02275 [Spongiactinospora rosea]
MMIHDHTTGFASILIVRRQPDGTTLARRWHTRACCAETLAAQLGKPHEEMLATAPAADAVRDVMRDTPGIIWDAS